MHTIKCPNCGEEYAASYKRCPFCDDTHPVSRSNKSGGKRLAVNRKKKRFWRRFFFFLSIILIIAAICIVVSIVQTLFGEKGTDATTDVTPSVAVSPTPDNGEGDGVLTGIALEPSEVNLAAVRDTQQLTVVPTPANASAEVTWQSSNPAVASVSETGLVTAVSNGTATITATSTSSETITVSCVVTVGSSETSASPTPSDSQASTGSPQISRTDFTLFSAGETYQLRVTGVSGTVEWSVENSAIATVSSDGVVTAVSAGMTTVTATVDGQTFSCIVRVR